MCISQEWFLTIMPWINYFILPVECTSYIPHHYISLKMSHLRYNENYTCLLYIMSQNHWIYHSVHFRIISTYKCLTEMPIKMTDMGELGSETFLATKMALATKNKISVASWLPENGTGDQKQISSSQLANKNFSQRRAL